MLGSLQRNAYRLPSDSIWTVPQAVSQPPTGDITSQTQWSAKYKSGEASNWPSCASSGKI